MLYRVREIIEKLRAGVQLASRVGKMPFIETGTYRRIRDKFDAVRVPGAVCKFAVIIGPTGGQKTESAKYYCDLNNHGKCVHLEAPDTPTMGEAGYPSVAMGTWYGISAPARTPHNRVMPASSPAWASGTLLSVKIGRAHV